jgi:hypothetical protein
VLPDAIEQRDPPVRAAWARRLKRRMGRALRRRLHGSAPPRPAARLDLACADELSTAELWSAWTLANLECALELKAWTMGTRSQRPRAFHGYCAALAREARVAELLAERHAL